MKTPNWFIKKNIVSFALWPLSLVYFFFSKLVFWSRKKKQIKSKIPVICIGNIFAGGVGKTPLVRLVAGHYHIPIVMRGYGGKSGKEKCVTQEDTFRDVGDEAKLLAHCGNTVYIGDRAKNIEHINATSSPRAIVMDDGFQNPTVKKDISILVFDGGLRFGNGFMLPAGPLREPLSAIERADAIVIMKRKKSLKNGGNEFIKKLEEFGKPIFYAQPRSLDPGIYGNVIAFAGIGYPQKFFDSVAPLYGDRLIKTFAFPDHHEYTEADFKKLFTAARKAKAQLVTTDKDWVRLPKDVRTRVQFAKLETVIPLTFWIWLGDKLKSVGKND